MDTYSLVLYGSQLWKYSKNDVNAFYIAWRKVVRRIWKIPSTTHCKLLPATNKSLPIEFWIEKRCAKCIWSCSNSHNLIVRNISLAAKISSFSNFGDNYRYLSNKYGIGIHVWHLPLCKLYKYFDLFLLNRHKKLQMASLYVIYVYWERITLLMMIKILLAPSWLIWLTFLYFVISLLYCSYVSFCKV